MRARSWELGGEGKAAKGIKRRGYKGWEQAKGDMKGGERKARNS